MPLTPANASMDERFGDEAFDGDRIPSEVDVPSRMNMVSRWLVIPVAATMSASVGRGRWKGWCAKGGRRARVRPNRGGEILWKLVLCLRERGQRAGKNGSTASRWCPDLSREFGSSGDPWRRCPESVNFLLCNHSWLCRKNVGCVRAWRNWIRPSAPPLPAPRLCPRRAFAGNHRHRHAASRRGEGLRPRPAKWHQITSARI